MGLLSLALGLLLALLTFAIVGISAGNLAEGGYCSPQWGIPRYESPTAAKMVAYIDDGWSGVPPTRHCSIYLVKAAEASSEEALRDDPPPHELLAVDSYPGTSEYAWIFGVLLLPPAIWGFWALLAVAGRTRRPATPL